MKNAEKSAFLLYGRVSAESAAAGEDRSEMRRVLARFEKIDSSEIGAGTTNV